MPDEKKKNWWEWQPKGIPPVGWGRGTLGVASNFPWKGWGGEQVPYTGARLPFGAPTPYTTAVGGTLPSVALASTMSMADILADARAAALLKKPPTTPPTGTIGYRPPTEDPGEGREWIFDTSSGAWYSKKVEPSKPTTYPREAGQPETWTDNNGIIYAYDVDTNDYIKIGYDPTKDQTRLGGEEKATEDRAWRQQQLDAQERQQQEMLSWYREQAQMQAEQQKQQQLAQLRANPASWLEYASLAGQTPSIQPWMLPLMGQQYAGAQAGQALPGYQAGGTSMAGLAQLTTPSRQYQARMGPTASAQYGGYERARSGITPEEQQFRLWSQAPPGGRYGGLSWMR